MLNWCYNQVAIISNNKKQLKKINKLLTDTSDKNYFYNKFYKQINYPLLFMIDFINITISKQRYSNILEKEIEYYCYKNRKDGDEKLVNKIINKIEEGINEILKDEDTYEFLKDTLEKSSGLFTKNIIKKLGKKRKKLLKKKHIVYIKHKKK